MDKNNLESLKLENQLCFPLYAASREVIKLYHPLLTELNLTYTQYLVMLVVWENEMISEKDLGRLLYLDSGTLTPVLKSLEGKKVITRSRSKADERVVNVTLTAAGKALRDKAESIPGEIADKIPLSGKDAKELYTLLYRLLEAGRK